MSMQEQIMNASKDHLGRLEIKLNGLLQPISPRTEFVDNLRHRIQVTQTPAFIGRFTNIQFILITLMGVLSGVVLVMMVAKGLVGLLVQKNDSSEGSS